VRQDSRRTEQELGVAVGGSIRPHHLPVRRRSQDGHPALRVPAFVDDGSNLTGESFQETGGLGLAVCAVHVPSLADSGTCRQWQLCFTPFELGVICEVFGVDRRDDGLPAYDFGVVAGEPGPIRSANGFTVEAPFGLERLEHADLVAVPAVSNERIGRAPVDYPEPLLAALRGCVARGTRVLSVCNGAFVLGAAGLLDGRRCTTHWRHAADLARIFPDAKVDPSVLYVDEDPVITSAGTAAGIDACLYLVRKEQGSRVANGIARRMVVPPLCRRGPSPGALSRRRERRRSAG
jgi:transcriptional regulator GlxA family with amidase domain